MRISTDTIVRAARAPLRQNRGILHPFSALPIALALLVAGAGCGAGDVRKSSTYDPKQPLYPVKSDDPFFHKKTDVDEIFRVLVSRDDYQVRQVAAKKLIRRSRDPEEDLERLADFRELHDRYNFADQTLTAMLSVRLNPHSGKIQNIEFIPTHNPQSWQVGRLMQHDLSRYQFSFPTGQVKLHTFRIRFLFRITRDPTLTDEEARRKAVELLQSERR